jgi:ketosteroid isomerase-like protein
LFNNTGISHIVDVRKELETVLKALESAVARNADAAEIGRIFYDDQVVVVSEGMKAATRGFSAWLPGLQEYLDDWGAGTRLNFKLVDPVLASESVASGFLDVTCQPGKPGAVVRYYRVLTSWRKGERGWRVAFEMISNGSM